MILAARTVTVVLDKERHLKWNYNRIRAFCMATGKSPAALAEPDNLTADDYLAAIWAALVWEDPDLTMEQLGEMVDPSNMEELFKKFGELQRPLSESPTP